MLKSELMPKRLIMLQIFIENLSLDSYLPVKHLLKRNTLPTQNFLFKISGLNCYVLYQIESQYGQTDSIDIKEQSCQSIPCDKKCSMCFLDPNSCLSCQKLNSQDNLTYAYQDQCITHDQCMKKGLSISYQGFKCTKCNVQNCKACINEILCGECNEGYIKYLHINEQRQRYDECRKEDCQGIVGYDQYEKNICIQCLDKNCIKCKDFYCFECQLGYKRLGNICKQGCQKGYLNKNTYQCENCDDIRCVQCNQNKYQCEQCDPIYYISQDNQQCGDCPSTRYAKFMDYCQKCEDENCQHCYNYQNICTQCIRDSRYNKLYQYQCVDECPIETLEKDFECKSCGNNCAHCTSNIKNQYVCLKCKGDKYESIQGVCQEKCSIYKFRDYSDNQCYWCHISCASCFGQRFDQCESCRDEKLMVNDGICQSQGKDNAMLYIYIISGVILFLLFGIFGMLFWKQCEKRKQIKINQQQQALLQNEHEQSDYSQQQLYYNENKDRQQDRIVCSQSLKYQQSQYQRKDSIFTEQENKTDQFGQQNQINQIKEYLNIPIISRTQFQEKYQKIQLLGEGTFGQVEKYADIQQDRQVAIKFMKYFSKEINHQQYLLELYALKEANQYCEYIVGLIDYFYIDISDEFHIQNEQQSYIANNFIPDKDRNSQKDLYDIIVKSNHQIKIEVEDDQQLQQDMNNLQESTNIDPVSVKNLQKKQSQSQSQKLQESPDVFEDCVINSAQREELQLSDNSDIFSMKNDNSEHDILKKQSGTIYQKYKYKQQENQQYKNRQLCIVFEVAEFNLGEIISHRYRYKEPFNVSELKVLFTNTIKGLYSLHKNMKLAHRDIKPQNILFINGQYKLCDLGLAKNIDHSFFVTNNHTPAGTLNYVSPEQKQNYIKLLQGQNYNQVPYNVYKSDTFSLGLTLFQATTLTNVSGMNERPGNVKMGLDKWEKQQGDQIDQKVKWYVEICRQMMEWDSQQRADLKDLIQQLQ